MRNAMYMLYGLFLGSFLVFVTGAEDSTFKYGGAARDRMCSHACPRLYERKR